MSEEALGKLSLIQELLAEYEHIKISYSTLSRLLKNASITSKRKYRTLGRRFKRRQRREASGELLQADATSYDWFKDGKNRALHAFIDDATGRVEKLWDTLQDRLTVWLKLEGITTMEQANRELHLYIAAFNDRFAVQPRHEESAFVPLGDSYDLDKLLAVCQQRTTDNCGCFSFQNFIFQIDSARPLAKKKILFLFSWKIGFLAMCGNEYYPVSALGLRNKNRITHIPDVVKILMQNNYYADGRVILAV